MSIIERTFTMSPILKDVSKLHPKNGKIHSTEEVHFGVKCKVALNRSNDRIAISLICEPVNRTDRKTDVDYSFEITPSEEELKKGSRKLNFDGKLGWRISEDLGWQGLVHRYTSEDQIRITFFVTFRKVGGIYKEPLRRFDKSMEHFSDVVVKVDGEEFYVSKLTLASHSPYFDRLFRGGFQEANTSTVELKNVDPADFQDYLEVLYLKSPISDSNIEQLLELADMYDTPAVIEKCVEYLLNSNPSKTNLSRKDKFRLSAKFNLETIPGVLFLECVTLEDLRDSMPDDSTDFESTILKDPFDEKLGSFSAEGLISGHNVELILELAIKYGTQVVVEKCEEHLMDKNAFWEVAPIRERLRISARFRLHKVMKFWFDQAQTYQGLRDIMPRRLDGTYPTILTKAMKERKKALEELINESDN